MLLRRTLLVLLLLPVAACIDDPASLYEDPIPLTEEEAEILGLGIWRDAIEARLDVEADTVELAQLGALAGPAAAPVPFAASASQVTPCTLGGDVSTEAGLTGFVDEEAGEVLLDFRIVQTHEDCREQGDGTTYTLIGAPSITAEFIFDFDVQGHFDIDGSITGGIVVLTGGRSVACQVDLAFTGQQDPGQPATSTVRGTLCGVPVERTATEGA